MEQDQHRIFLDHWSTERMSSKTAFYALMLKVLRFSRFDPVDGELKNTNLRIVIFPCKIEIPPCNFEKYGKIFLDF
jgi:hypothetical protein